MCIGLAIRYEYEKEKARKCRVCHREETAEISKESDDAFQKTWRWSTASMRPCGSVALQKKDTATRKRVERMVRNVSRHWNAR
jgi:hypothetical protein